MKAAELVEEVILVAKIEVLEIVSDDADRAVLGEDEVREIGKRPERDEERNRVPLQPRGRLAHGAFRDVSMLGNTRPRVGEAASREAGAILGSEIFTETRRRRHPQRRGKGAPAGSVARERPSATSLVSVESLHTRP